MVRVSAEIGTKKKRGNPNPSPSTRFGSQKSNPMNPGGKPVASRNRLQGDFVRALADDFEANGKAAIKECREQKPDRYLAVIASLLPKEIELKRQFDDLTDEQLAAAVAAARSLAAAVGEDPGEGADASGLTEPAQVVPAVQETERVP